MRTGLSDPRCYVARACISPAVGQLTLGIFVALMLCEICQERAATIHTTKTESETESRAHFCRECFETRGPIPGFRLVEGVVETCHYCGAVCEFDVCGSPPATAVIPGATGSCRECAHDLQEYFDKHLQPTASENEFTSKLDAFMRKRVAERRRDA